MLSLLSLSGFAQEVVKGQVIDGETGDPVFAAGVVVQGTTTGTSTDFDGRFRIEVPTLPVRLSISFIGYSMLTVDVNSADNEVRATLQPDAVLMEEAEVVGSRIDERQKQGPLTVESMDVLAIKEAPSGNFYESLGNLKGVGGHSLSVEYHTFCCSNALEANQKAIWYKEKRFRVLG